MNYCEKYLVCSQRNEGRIHEQKKKPLVLDLVLEDELTTEENYATDWRTPYFKYFRNGQVIGENTTNGQTNANGSFFTKEP